MSEKKTPSRLPLFLTLIAAGVFLIGAVLFPLLLQGQAGALQGTGIILAPVTLNLPAPRLSLTSLQGKPASLEEYRG